ncbi:MAG: hypothetical protein TREMPRED_002208 [Tremellales sp. Tagirdzhanova-0007]|nr:MAG: hypothetical protein TREMPRED_002208 [Tremellales sp. Tagirdzhanova-0007]
MSGNEALVTVLFSVDHTSSFSVDHTSSTFRLGLVATSEAELVAPHNILTDLVNECRVQMIPIKAQLHLNVNLSLQSKIIKETIRKRISLASGIWNISEVDDSKMNWIPDLRDDLAKWDLGTQTLLLQEFTDVVCNDDDEGAVVIYNPLCRAVGDSVEVSVHSAISTNLSNEGDFVPYRTTLANASHDEFKEYASRVVKTFAAKHKHSKNEDSVLSDQLLTELQSSIETSSTLAYLQPRPVRYIAISYPTFVALNKYLEFEAW